MMESPEFNLSVLENVTTFSTPLKDCSDYEDILSMIKEEIDISQTEDEGDDQLRPNNASCPRGRRPDSESRDYDDKFKPPYGINHSAKSKSPGTALFSRTRCRSLDDSKDDTRKQTAQRVRTLGRIMPGRSLKSSCRQHRSSGCYSDTSGLSDPVENGKTPNRKSLTPRKKFDYDATDAYETEGEALEELLTMAQEQVIVNGSPCGRNSTVSSQGESTSLATSDPLDTGAMEEECYVESSQPICISDFHKKLLNHRSICDMPKNVETIKRNLHFSDAPESEEDNQNFSLALSPEPTSLLNYDIDGNSAPAAVRKRKESLTSISNSLSLSSSNFYSQREPSTTPPRPRTGESSRDSIARALNSLTPNSYNSQNQREASATSQLSSMSKTSRESTPGIQNSTYDLHVLERKRQTSTTPQPCTRKPSRESTPSTASTLNVIHNLEELEPKREASMTPEPCTRKMRQGSTTSTSTTASTLNLSYDLQDLEPKWEASTPQHSNTSEASQHTTASILKNLTQDLQNLDPEREASTTPEPPSMRKTSQNNTPSTLEKLAQNLQDLDPERDASTALEPSSMRKTSQDSTANLLKNLTQDLPDFDPEREISTTLEPSSMRNTSKDSTSSTPENLAQDPKNFNPKKEASATLPQPRKRKTRRHSRDTLLKNLTQEFDLNNLHSAKKASQDSIDRTSKSLTLNSCNSHNQREASPTAQYSSMRKTRQDSTANIHESVTQDLHNLDPKRAATTVAALSRHRKMSQGSIANSQESLTQELENLNLKREASATPPYPRNRETSQDSIANSQESLTEDLQHSDFKRGASATPPYSRHRRTSQNSMGSSQKSSTRELSSVDSAQDTRVTLPRPGKRSTSQTSTVSSSKSPTRDPSNVDSAKEATVTPPRPKKKRKKKSDIATSLEGLTQDTSNVDPAKEASVTPPRPKHLETSQDSIANSQNSLTEDLQNLDFKREASATPPSPRHRRTSQNSMGSSQNSFNQELSSVDSAQDTRVTLPRPRKRKTSQSSTVSSAKSPTRDPSNVDSAKEASVTPPRPKKKRKKKSDIATSLEGLTQDTSNVDPPTEASVTPPRPKKKRKRKSDIATSLEGLTQDTSSVDPAKEASVTPLRPRHRETSQGSIANSQESLTEDLQNLDFKREASATPPSPRHCRTSQNSIGSSQKIFTQELSSVDSAQDATVTLMRPRKLKTSQTSTVSSVDSAKEASPPPPRSTKRKNKTKIASPPKNVTQNLTDLVCKREPSMTPPRPRKRKSSVASPLKGLTQELENCMMNVDFERLCEEIDNDTESPSFTFETVQLLDDYDDCNPEAKNKILSKILTSPNSKTDEEAPRSVEHIGSSEDPLDYDPLYIAEAQDNVTAIPSTSKRKEKTGTKKAGNERKSLTVDKSIEESEGRIDKDDRLEEGPRRSSRPRKKRVTMTMSDWEEEVDLSDKAAQVPNKAESSSEDSLDYDALYIADDEDNESMTPSTSKSKEKTVTKEKGKKRKSLPVDKSFTKSIRTIDKDGTLEEGTRRSKRTRKMRVSMTISDWEDEVDLSDEAAEVAEKVKAAKKKERLSSRTWDKLNNIVVQFRHEVLPQHDIEPRAGTAPLTYEQQCKFLDYASLNKDVYTTAEDEIIKRNWNAFCEDHDWDPQNYRVFLQFKHGDHLIMSSVEERRKFVQFLADGLPNRPLFSVYNRFKKIYSEYADAGEWYSPEEDKKILAYMLHNPEKKPETKFAELSKVLRRPRDSIWKRYKNLKQKEVWHEKSKKVMMKVEWDLSLVTEFITKLLDVTISDDLMELKDAFIPIVVWRKLEEKIEIDYKFMKRSWEQQFHLQFFSPEPLSANATKIRLIEYMWMKGIRDGKEIEWHVVVKYFDGCTISFLRKMFNHLTAEASIALKSRNLSDIMKWLHEIKIGRLRRSPNDHYLPRLRYVDRRVEIVPEDTAKVTLISKRDSLY